MNRFSRVVGLRRIREEAEAMAYARALARLEALRGKVRELDRVTARGREERRQELAEGGLSMPPEMFEGFLKGQAWRRERLLEAINRSLEEVRKAKEVWHGVRVQLQQIERLEEKEGDRLHAEARRQEMKALDAVSMLQYINRA
ncbi:MAG: flagellar export protein FliJ [Magnetococcales bacterium]|nr:flagellar export protein FliJ [Magnetococcales bacterium]